MKYTADMLALIKIALNLKLPRIEISYSNLNLMILKKFFKLGYIRGFLVLGDKEKIIINFRYFSNRSIIRNCFLISKPSKKIYFKSSFLNQRRIKKFLEINGFLIYSTNLGILTDIESLMTGIGGEPICFIN